MTQENNGQGMTLMATISADELARLNRRVVYLEAVAVQLMRGRGRIKEWFTAAELQALRLPGLPLALNAVTRHARQQNWRRRVAPGPGRSRYEYHFTTLPRRAFESLLDRVLCPAGAGIASAPAPRRDNPECPSHSSAEPPWLLPLMRIIRQGGPRTVCDAVDRLAGRLPDGVKCPTYGEAEQALQRLGMIGEEG